MAGPELVHISWKGSKVQVKWGNVPEADTYEVYAAYCGAANAFQKVATVQGANKIKITRLNGKKLNRKKCVKAYVIAYRNGTPIGRTFDAHAAGAGHRDTNAKKIKLSKKTYKLTPGGSAKIKASVIKMNSRKKLIGNYHCPQLRYYSSNEAVAQVSANGRITAISPGTCEVWIYAQNGRSRKVTVIVQ